ncbi:MAG: hypothetical protein ACO26G_01785 [Rickettsiales bacterium]
MLNHGTLMPNMPQPKNENFWQAMAERNYPLVNHFINSSNNLFYNCDENGVLPIVVAIQNHDSELFRSLMVNPAFYNFLDSGGNSLALIAIKNNNLAIFQHLIQVNPNLLTKENNYGEAPIFEILEKNHEEIFDFINENYPKLMFFKNRFGKSMIEKSIESKNPRFFAEILKKFPKGQLFFGDDFEDPSRNNFINNIDGDFFRKALSHIEKDELKKILYHTYDDDYSLLDKIMRSNRNDLLLSILEKDPNIFENYDDILVLSDAFDNKLNNQLHLLMPIQLFFKKKFGLETIDNETTKLLKDFFDFSIVLLLINNDKDLLVIFSSFHDKHNTINQATKNFFKDDNKFYEIYNLIYDAIKIPKNEKLIQGVDGKFLIMSSDIFQHTSFFVFKFDKNNRITEVSYCDGNRVYDEQEIDRNAEQIFAATTFKLSHPIENTRDFINEFMDLNRSSDDFEAFYQRGVIFPRGVEYSYSVSVPTKMQIRGNCTLKSLNILAQFMANQLNPNPVEYQFDDGKLYTYDKEQYKLHKDKINEYCYNSLGDIVEYLEEKSNKNKLEEFFLAKGKEIIDKYENKQIDKASRDFEEVSSSPRPVGMGQAQISGVGQPGF